MTVASLAEDWLVNNAVIVFVSALLVGQTLAASEDTWKVALIIVLLVLSVFYTVAAVVPFLRHWALRQGSYWSPGLSFLAWIAFVAGLASSLSELPWDRCPSIALLLVGVLLALFLLVRFILQVIQVNQARHPPSSLGKP